MRRFLYKLKFVLLSGAVAALFSEQAYPGGGQNVSATHDFRRDPVKLIDALRSPISGHNYKAAFDLKLTANAVFGPETLAKLSGEQQETLSRSFERLVEEELISWRDYRRGPILEHEVKNDRASLLLTRGNDLMRVKFIARDGVWNIVEVEDLDRDIPLFADALRDSLEPGKGRARLFKMPADRALKQVEALIAAEDEQPSLLLLKALLVGRRDYEQARRSVTEANYDEPIRIRGRNQGHETLQRIRSRWPNYAPAHYAYATEDFVGRGNRAAVVTALTKYTRLRPLDPRGWYWLGYEQSLLHAFGEAEIAYREAVRLAPSDEWCVEGLFRFYLDQGEMAKPLELLKNAIQLLENVDNLFESLHLNHVLLDEAQLKKLEAVLLEKPDRLANSQTGLLLLASAQVRLGKNEAARSTIQQIRKLGLWAGAYIRLAHLNRELHLYEDAADAARQAISLERYDSGAAYFHLACALAQLDRKQEAIDALRKYEEATMRLIGIDYRREPDLKPLADMPEFKELTRKYDVRDNQPISAPRRRLGGKKRPK